MSLYEINMADARLDMDSGRVRKASPVVEVFSALTAGRKPDGIGSAVIDESVKQIRELGEKAASGDQMAQSEINAIVRYSIEPKLLESIRLFDFMGTFRRIGYHEAPRVRTYRYDSVDSRFQASSSDVPFATYSWKEYPVSTQTISGGFAVDYRELQSGNFDGSVAEGMNQVKIDMQNKAVYYVISRLYDGIKNAAGVKHFAESAGVTKASVDAMLKVMRRYGRVNIMGDYSVVSQFNGFSGYITVGSDNIPFGADAVADEIRKSGLVSYYNGAFVTELPNAINWNKLNADGTDYELYMPQGLLFFVPRGTVSPLQIFQRGGLTSMTGTDIVTRQHMTRFDLEIGAELAKGMEDQIGLISDSNFDAPSV